ncbi:hypothetical protein KUTeg_022579 [Tegillarca granosa]|uniref:Cilia- and flagella-associated protein 53 n=1 Tax=Tegillarca granosa TaxID=220873 RepID=A0ABQ9E8E3_TEGGR|nr:hypothetical protein KUTeg_022579 [Tegillarca granosa]
MMVANRTRRTREFTGPTPHSVAIKARAPNTRPPEYLILERRKKEEKLEEYRKNTQYMEFSDLKNEWERGTDRKIKLNTMKRRVDGLFQAHQFTIEDRRERLRAMLHAEEQQYLMEMEDKEETTIERQAKMRMRAKSLKDKREAERLQFVQEKYDQQFRNQCEELRSTLSKQQQDQVCVERLEQLRIKEQMALEKQAQEEMYAHLWEQDMLAKAAREDRDAKAAHERNQDVLNVLRKQMAALDEQKKEAERLKEEEAQLLREQAMLRKLEEQRALEEKLRMQDETRRNLDLSLKLKMKKKAKEEQEQLAFDLKMLEQLLEESRNEAMEQLQRKLMEEERVKEKALEDLVNSEVEKMWQKRLAQWMMEREARKKLMEDVMHVAQNDLKQREAERERLELLKVIEENKILEQQQIEKRLLQNRTYQRDLEGQIDFNARQRALELEQERQEYMLGMQAEREFQAKLKKCLDNPEYDRLHPMRRAMQNSAQLKEKLNY